jgi:DNA-binding NarL/FixJ family response regulator
LTEARQPLCHAAVLAATAVSLGRSGDPAGAWATYERAETILAEAPWCRHVFRRLVAGAAHAEGWPFPAEGLVESARYFGGEGLVALATACRNLVRAAGLSAPDPVTPDRTPGTLRRFGLTERETDVALLLVEGLSNRQIAERLFLSPRTAEKHVERLLQKTGAASRSALVALTLGRPR